jgi:hypothetical protein
LLSFDSPCWGDFILIPIGVYFVKACDYLLSAKRAYIGVQTRHATNQQGDPLPPDGHLSTNGAARADVWHFRMEEACPLAKPLVKSLHSVLAYWVAIVAEVDPKRPVIRSENF